uniref:Uncharacterized protein n=1 Tax=Tanacetum cinerariifolium TaxID=118510 RepID=A0A6L2MT63_TANCI|nr:hypothetical protein [Tanacetum cinerariifolium]
MVSAHRQVGTMVDNHNHNVNHSRLTRTDSKVSDKSKAGLGYREITPDRFVNSSEILKKQETRLDKGYHAVPPPLTGNYMPLKRDLRLIDKHFESMSMDVISNNALSDVKTVESKHKTVDVNHKGVFSTVEPKPVRKNSFSPPIIEDWHSDDESEVEISPTVEVQIVKPSIEKIKFVKTAKETVKNEESPKQHKHHPKGNQRNWNNLIVLDLEKTKTAQAKEIANLKKKVKKLERKRRSRTLVMNLFKIGPLEEEVWDTKPYTRLRSSRSIRLGSTKDKMEHVIELIDLVLQTPHDSPLLKGHTPRSDEFSMTLKELTDLCTTLSQKVLDLEKVKTAQAKVITSLKKRVTKLEQSRSLRILGFHPFRVGTSGRHILGRRNVSKQGRKNVRPSFM